MPKRIRGKTMNTNNRRLFGERIKALRKERNLSQEQLAQLASFHPTYIQKVESGRIVPSLRAVVRLGRVMKVPVSHLVEVFDQSQEAETQSESIESISGLLRNLPTQQVDFVRGFIEYLNLREYRQKAQ